MTIFVFTDGAFSRSTRLGGWACVAVQDGQEIWRASGQKLGTTNNRMELTGILQALSRCLRASDNVIVTTDSQYCISVLTRSHKRLNPLNDDLIRQCINLINAMPTRPKFEWVKGHSGHQWDELADKLATDARGGKTLA